MSERIAGSCIETRRYLHQRPELSYEEYETSAFVQARLSALGIPFEVMAGTGVVAIVRGLPSDRTVALRADMDALPIQEENQSEYASQRPGVMHACGHDVHTAILLGAAEVLSEIRDSFHGTVKLIFQPGEERNPGGASYMIAAGALENPRPQGIVALHVNPFLETGKLSFRKGTVMASADELYFTIKGKGGHAAAPHLTADTVLIAAQLIVSLQQLISRNRDPFSPSVLSICSVNGGNTTNVIPSEVHLKGTFRAMDETWRRKAHAIIAEHSKGLVEALGGRLDLHIDVGYPTVNNDPAFTGQAWQLARQFLGEANVEETELRMGAEDFGYYTQHVPGCFFRLGTRNTERGIVNNVHTPKFDIDEAAIPIGVGTMAFLGATLGPGPANYPNT